MSNTYAYYHKLSTKTKIFNFFRRIFKQRFLEKKLSEVTRNKSSNSFFAKFVPPEYLYASPNWRSTNINSINYHLDISKKMDHHVYFGFDIPGMKQLLEILTDDSVIIDVGANIGATGLQFANKASKGSVYCFEPVTKTFERLEKNFAINQYTNFTLINKGLGSNEETVEIGSVLDSNPAMNRIVNTNFTNSKIAPIELIDISTVDVQIEKLSLKRIDCIKIDVEGYELEVLKGAKSTLIKCKPILFIELGDKNLKEQGSSANELVNYLIELRYNLYRSITNERIDIATNLDGIHFDILCIHKDSSLTLK